MIVRMAKIEIAGPKALLLDVLALVQELGLFQVEPEPGGFVEAGVEAKVRPLVPDEQLVAERMFLENLGSGIAGVLSALPRPAVGTSPLDPRAALEVVAAAVGGHGAWCREQEERLAALRRERDELQRHAVIVEALDRLLAGVPLGEGVDCIGLVLREPAAVERLRWLVANGTGGVSELLTAVAADGTTVCLIVTVRERGAQLRELLGAEQMPELELPAAFAGLPFPERIRRLRGRLDEAAAEMAAIGGALEDFARTWGGAYLRAREWVENRLSLLRLTARVHETLMCFVIHGWMPADGVPGLEGELAARFGGRVVVEEKALREQDLQRIPVALKNPPYFQPFELFSRMLPLPRYTSYDPTPFIGVFFPLFFGMILGDAGHGTVLLLASLAALRIWPGRPAVRDAARILLVSSLSAIVFGFAYGEFFGELGGTLFGLRPLIVERRTAIVSMLWFSLAVGTVHVTLGLFLGFLSAVRRHTGKEALFRLTTIAAILCLALLVVSLFQLFPRNLARPAIIALVALVPLLLATGGFIAPLEFLRTVGNILSYARIMAIGLASVLLASMANTLAGMTGDIVTGIIVAGLLHTVNLVLGVFSPTIQSLRLHYVEFFSKFLEHGGRAFDPFRKSRTDKEEESWKRH